jgi:hypothetical protein
MMLTASANATMLSYALAEGDTGAAMVASVVEGLVVCAIAAALTVPLGGSGIGLALTVSTIFATVILAAGTHPLVRRALFPVAKATAIAAAAAGAAQLLDASHDLAGLGVSLAIVSLVWLALELLFARGEIRQIARLARPLLSRTAAT